ncbi:hypothetical protein ASF22_15670 [Methylobacterium sp. Leaf87]|uniref:hypothetical protein n=1 Tax=Methylobacterium sp. Leaf87 TaxID=1736243 RepID=UPI0006FC5B58|nr:hypothetical protein [Methylobacterium sp. Leaf87]KQO71358.1 hypothetical protein ASF22_15670 [Methylobacterium sp. Leaf87]
METLLVLLVLLFGPAVALTICSSLFGRRTAVALWRYAFAWLYAAVILYGSAELAWWTFAIGVEETDSGPLHFANTVVTGLLILSAGFTWFAARIQISESKTAAPPGAIR